MAYTIRITNTAGTNISTAIPAGNYRVYWTASINNQYYYNSTGTTTSARFVPKSGSFGFGSSGFITVVAQEPVNDIGGEVASNSCTYTLRTGSSSGFTMATSNTVTVYRTPDPPTSVFATDITTSSFKVTASGGYWGVLQVAVGSSPYAASGTVFSGLAENTEYTLKARRINGGVTASSEITSTATTLANPIDPDLNVTVPDYIALDGVTTLNLALTNATNGEDYRLIKTTGTDVVVDIITNYNSSTNRTFQLTNSELPPEGDTWWYQVQARRNTNDSPPGDGNWKVTNLSGNSAIWVRRQNDRPTFTLSDDNGVTTVTILANVTNNSSHTPTNVRFAQYKNGVAQGTETIVNWTGNGLYNTSLTQPRDVGTDTYVYTCRIYVQGINGTTAVPFEQVHSSSSTSISYASDPYIPGTFVDTDISLTVGGDATPPIYHTTGAGVHPAVTATGCGADTIYWITTSNNITGNMVGQEVGRTYTTSTTRTFYGPTSTGNGSTITDVPSIGTSKNYYIYASDGLGDNAVYTGDTYRYSRPDTSITLAPSTTSLTSTSTSNVTVNVTGDTSGTQYRLYTYNIPRWVATYNGGSSTTTDFTILYSESELPPPGSTYTYFSQARIPAASGGTDVWINTLDQFDISRAAYDTTPNSFDLGGPVTNASLSTNYFSNTITVAGMDTGAPGVSVAVSGTGSPAFSKNGGSYTTSTGVEVVNGDTLTLRVTSSASGGGSVTGTLTLAGSVSDSFTVTTTSGGSGGGTTIPEPGASNYGLNVYSSTGKLVFSPAHRNTNIVGSGSIPIPANGTTTAIPFEGMTPTNTTDCIVYFPGGNAFLANFLTSINRGTNSFTITNNFNQATTVNYICLRIG